MDRGNGRLMTRTGLLALVCGLGIGLSEASAQSIGGGPRPTGVQRMEAPPTSQALVNALAAPFLTAQEAKERRVFHGMWEAGDLDSVEMRARAALLVGAIDHESLFDPAAAIEDRAEASMLRGEIREALSMLEGAPGFRAIRIRTQAHELLGDYDGAMLASDPLVRTMRDERLETAPDLVEAARVFMIRARIDGRAASEYHEIIAMLRRAQEEVDRLYWPAVFTQAQLLYEKDNRAEAGQALMETLTLNPRCGAAWHMLGMLSVDSLDIDQVENVALTMDANLELEPPPEEEGEDEKQDAEPAFESYMGDLITARGFMRLSMPDRAIEALEPSLERYPKMRELLATAAAAHATNFDYETTDEILAGLAELSPGSALGPFYVGRALSEARQYAKSAEYLEAATERQPNWSEPWIELGLMELQSGRDTEALTALRRATELDEFNIRARNSRTLLEELVTYDTLESEHFRIRYRPGIDEIMARDMLEPLDVIHENVASVYGWEPEDKTVLELMPDHEWFGVRIAGMPAIHTIAAATGPVIAMEAPKIGKQGLYSGPYDWPRVVQHEYVHTITLGRAANRLPLWYTEACAVDLESPVRDWQRWQLITSALENDGLHDFDGISLAFTRPKTRFDRPLAYAQGQWMLEYMMEIGGRDATLQLLDLYAEGVLESEAFERVFGITTDRFLEDFKEWGYKDARAHGMLIEPSVRDMLLEISLDDPENTDGVQAMLAELGIDRADAVEKLEGVALDQFEVTLAEPTPEVVEELLEQYPDHPDLLQMKIEYTVFERGGRVDDSMVPLLEHYARVRPVDPLPHRHLARLYLESDDKSRAIEHLEFLDAREQSSPSYAIELARRYAAISEWDRAWAKISRATQISPFDAGHRELAATVALRRGDYASAERHIVALTELEPQHELHQKRLEAVRRKMSGEG